MSDAAPAPARRPRGRPRRETPTETSHQRLEAEIADWYAAESIRTGMPIATIQRLVLTRYVRERVQGKIAIASERAPAAPGGAPAPPPPAPRPSRFARSRYLGG